jgi:hypothetical protein
MERHEMDWVISGALFVFIVATLVMLRKREGRSQ